jgi:hypothetical protein
MCVARHAAVPRRCAGARETGVKVYALDGRADRHPGQAAKDGAENAWSISNFKGPGQK